MTDRWDERLRRPRCRKIGLASLLQDRGDDMPTGAVPIPRLAILRAASRDAVMGDGRAPRENHLCRDG